MSDEEVKHLQQITKMAVAFSTAAVDSMVDVLIELRALTQVLERNGLLKSAELQHAILQTKPDEIQRLKEEAESKMTQAILLRFVNVAGPFSKPQ